MAMYMTFSTLNDASVFLNTLKGLPDTKTARRRADVYTRAIVVFSWIALEEGMKDRLKEANLPVSNNRPWDDLKILLRRRVGSFVNSNVATTKKEFMAQRKLRNTVVHALYTDVPVTFQQAADSFEYCKGMLATIYGLPIKITDF